ncbi:hypothetical protein M758_6G039600 [Ceratodon purpureus]|uniref:Uncharacterized protein n=1 Tax=Ceratodon purpureus TaxID=3225 RepID=A0A8T0HBD3_CERPU|nr:hypothetical protein KC19_6G042400 [Ceratodon purpureus]KAG0612586.1 hypothetical protein M758_6G039600 [Ceratodon purpureus]
MQTRYSVSPREVQKRLTTSGKMLYRVVKMFVKSSKEFFRRVCNWACDDHRNVFAEHVTDTEICSATLTAIDSISVILDHIPSDAGIHLPSTIRRHLPF